MPAMDATYTLVSLLSSVRKFINGRRIAGLSVQNTAPDGCATALLQAASSTTGYCASWCKVSASGGSGSKQISALSLKVVMEFLFELRASSKLPPYVQSA